METAIYYFIGIRYCFSACKKMSSDSSFYPIILREQSYAAFCRTKENHYFKWEKILLQTGIAHLVRT